eukprot:6491352-Amphidinium_carterae.4
MTCAVTMLGEGGEAPRRTYPSSTVTSAPHGYSASSEQSVTAFTWQVSLRGSDDYALRILTLTGALRCACLRAAGSGRSPL